MIKILVISDTHGNIDSVQKLIKNTEHNYVFFLGDTLKDVANFNDEYFFKVKGNWDYGKTSTQEFITIDNIKFFITHGHYYGVKQGLNYLINLAEKEHVNVVCYGHTHLPDVSNINGVWYVNPGAFSSFKKGANTYALILLENNIIDVEIKHF